MPRPVGVDARLAAEVGVNGGAWMRFDNACEFRLDRPPSEAAMTLRAVYRQRRAGVALAMLLSACGADDGTPTDEGDVGNGASAETLPTVQTSFDCDPQALPVTVVDMATRSDAFVVGTVTAITPVDGPWELVEGGSPVETCATPALVGLDVELTDVDGNGVNSSESVAVRLTARELSGWSSRPAVSGGAVTWEPEPTVGIALGMRVGGFVVIPDESDTYVLTGPLVREVDGEVTWQPSPGYDECDSLPDLNGASAADIADEIEASGALATEVARSYANASYRRSGLCGSM